MVPKLIFETKYERAKSAGLGAVTDGDLMIDEASLKVAAKTVARHLAFKSK